VAPGQNSHICTRTHTMAAATNPPKTNGSTGYKEIFTGPKGFDWNLELEGSEGHPKASVNQPFCLVFSLDADSVYLASELPSNMGSQSKISSPPTISPQRTCA